MYKFGWTLNRIYINLKFLFEEDKTLDIIRGMKKKRKNELVN